MAFKKNLGFTVRCEKVMSASITQMQSYMSEAVEWPGVVDVLLWRAPFSVIFRLMESIIKKHAGKKKKRSPCHLLTQQNCKGERSEWQ